MNKMKLSIAMVCLMGIAGCSGFGQAMAAGGKIYSPQSGVLCDRQEGFCADRNGLSTELTTRFLGEYAADRLNDSHPHRRKSFTLSNGVLCSVHEHKCFIDQNKSFEDRRTTEMLYGESVSNEPQPLPDTNEAIFFPAKGIICDRTSNFCADPSGISMGLTQVYIGNTTALQSALGDMKNVNLASYTLSNGVFCDSQRRKCYDDKYRSRLNKVYTRNLFH
ncbi:hypothetical protein C3432_19510 [Citrobacter amalonaticus]|uniref:Lipoprotein n=1 Tax=Citrobacter amalonaticus TaxID=35703 RepID=A0A2S4RXL3_CITAM|nr:YcgJ family protein [Citrobacter amalonaticus]POT56165.1 hypothetical protein C3432_19510 [Citrobacter amalonaticus]POT74474.1 hypothetical protein C3436_17150 [Citrobacter amalonaticus]POU65273.1 hypothetical protein C3430_13890 [Citrobacter amalonaticus]POV04108.1 hypothetical protein C3424_18830 [Citrobacter amalonaticus]